MKNDLTNKLKWQRKSDLITLAVLSPILIPVTAIVMAASIIDCGRPPIYWQKRVGYLRKEFSIAKSRTMKDLDKLDPTGVLKAIYDEMSVEDRASFDNDFRISRWGRLMRKLRLDELPQMYNIIKGEMSIVGPRPHKAEDEINEKYPNRFLLRPGLTGEGKLAGLNGVSHDVEGRSDENTVEIFRERSALSLQFYRVGVCIKTPYAIVKYKSAPDAYMHEDGGVTTYPTHLVDDAIVNKMAMPSSLKIAA